MTMAPHPQESESMSHKHSNTAAFFLWGNPLSVTPGPIAVISLARNFYSCVHVRRLAAAFKMMSTVKSEGGVGGSNEGAAIVIDHEDVEEVSADGDAVKPGLAVKRRRTDGPTFNLHPCKTNVRGHDRPGGKAVVTSLFIVRIAPPMMAKQSSAPVISLLRCCTGKKSQYLVCCMSILKGINRLTCAQLEGNIVKVFVRFRLEGKATIRLRNPPQDIAISDVCHT